VGDTIKMFGIDEILFFQSDEKYTRVVTGARRSPCAQAAEGDRRGPGSRRVLAGARGVIVRASAIARAQRDELGRITLQLRNHAEKLAVSQAYGWRFKPM